MDTVEKTTRKEPILTHKQALQILIKNATENVHGAGKGRRAELIDEKKEIVLKAVQKVWKNAYEYSWDDNDKFNLGF